MSQIKLSYPKFLIGFMGIVIGLGLMAHFGVRIEPPVATADSETTCRFGITVPKGLTDGNGHDYRPEFPSLKVGAWLDWGARETPEEPNGAEYIHVLRVRDDLYPPTNLSALVTSNPGAYWLVGNEPDTVREGQDGVTPEVYADRYHALATQIRGLDPTAKVAFGSIVQPTPIRLRYLDRAWARLVELAGGEREASNLIDLWSIHAFVLNEHPTQWGAGVPPGMTQLPGELLLIDRVCNTWPSEDCFPDTHDPVLFGQLVEDFRIWLEAKGERYKPVWITEYGSLMPYWWVPEYETADYMTQTFDFLLSATDPDVGYPFEGDRLIQRWFWYSLNGSVEAKGGTLYDPDNDGAITEVGSAWVNYGYIQTGGFYADPIPAHVRVKHLGSGQYEFAAWIANQGDIPFQGGYDVDLFLGDPGNGGMQLDTTRHVDDEIDGCGEATVVTFTDSISDPIPWDLYLQLTPTVGGSDGNGGNNLRSFSRPVTFEDVAISHQFYQEIETLYFNEITAGCDDHPMLYCPTGSTLRNQMAVFLVRATHGSSFVPPDATGIFADVPLDGFFDRYIEQLYSDGITSGCAKDPLRYCPDSQVSRAEMAVFLGRAVHGVGFVPPPASGIFADVDPETHWAADWIEQAYADGITLGCGTDPLRYCPSRPVTRSQMAAFLVRAFDLTMP